jgi:carbon monoxide dehydrogenase subunit G
MPEAREYGRVNRNIETMWEFVKKMNNWAPCMPGFVSFEEIDENTSIWYLKGDMKVLKKKIDFTVRVTERKAPERIAFTLESKSEGIKGEGSYTAKSDEKDFTDVEFILKMSGQGMTKKVVNSILSKTLPRDCEILKENLIKMLEEKPHKVEY